MERKIPPAAFDFYWALGVKRSYQAVAEKFGVSKSAVVNCAKRENWQKRVDDIESQARESSRTKAVQTREESAEHYMKMWQAVERRSLEALRSYPLSSAIDAVRALNMATRNMMLLRGEPTDRVENVESVIRREYDRWLVRDGDRDDDGDGSNADERGGVADDPKEMQSDGDAP